MRIHDILLGPLLALIGLGLCLWAATLPHPGNVAFGPDLFPTLTGGGLALSGLVIGFTSLKHRTRRALFERPDWLKSRRTVLNFWLIPSAILAYFLLVDAVGFFLMAIAILFALMVASNVTPVRALMVAMLTAAVINLLFASLLHVPLPWGPLTSISGWLIW